MQLIAFPEIFLFLFLNCCSLAVVVTALENGLEEKTPEQKPNGEYNSVKYNPLMVYLSFFVPRVRIWSLQTTSSQEPPCLIT